MMKSPNRIKTIWNHLTGKKKAQNEILTIKVDDCLIDDQ